MCGPGPWAKQLMVAIESLVQMSKALPIVFCLLVSLLSESLQQTSPQDSLFVSTSMSRVWVHQFIEIVISSLGTEDDSAPPEGSDHLHEGEQKYRSVSKEGMGRESRIEASMSKSIISQNGSEKKVKVDENLPYLGFPQPSTSGWRSDFSWSPGHDVLLLYINMFPHIHSTVSSILVKWI